MGLTIHYNLKYKGNNPEQIVYKMRQIAMDLPFESVGNVYDVVGDECNYNNCKDETLRWLLIQANESVTFPWNKRLSRDVKPKKVIAFTTYPGDGCEPANFGLCLFPTEVELEYKLKDDEKFQSQKNGCFHEFDYKKWDRYCKKNNINQFSNFPPNDSEKRIVPTKLKDWSWGSFCKTQYASQPDCGGIPNFLKCHISVITALDKMAKLPGVKVQTNDEGHYGSARYSDDYREAEAAGRRATYVWHEGRYNPKELVKEIGEWNEMIAATFGALKDVIGTAPSGESMEIVAPIRSFPNFEQLEFRGQNLEYIKPFLNTMKELAGTLKQNDEPNTEE